MSRSGVVAEADEVGEVGLGADREATFGCFAHAHRPEHVDDRRLGSVEAVDANDSELRIAVGKTLLNLVADGVTDPNRLRRLTVESLSLRGH